MQNYDETNDFEYPKMLQFILVREGGYSNNPKDKGGPTNKGITHTTYDAYRKSKGLEPRSVKELTDEEMRDIYYNNYYKASGADKIDNPRLAMYVFDTAVNMGVSVAKELLRKSNGDLNTFENLRRQKYKSYAANEPDQKDFLQGWHNRVTHAKGFALNHLPEQRYTPFRMGIEMNVDENGNVIDYFDEDDLKNMNWDDAKKNAPKLFEQTKYHITHPEEWDKDKFWVPVNKKYENLSYNDRVYYQGDEPTAIWDKDDEDVTKQDELEFKVFNRQLMNDNWKLPTKEELDERVARGELIWVDGYTKQDGTVVKGYFRHYPETA